MSELEGSDNGCQALRPGCVLGTAPHAVQGLSHSVLQPLYEGEVTLILQMRPLLLKGIERCVQSNSCKQLIWVSTEGRGLSRLVRNKTWPWLKRGDRGSLWECIGKSTSSWVKFGLDSIGPSGRQWGAIEGVLYGGGCVIT